MSDIQHIEFIPLREVIWSPADKLLSYSMCDKRISEPQGLPYRTNDMQTHSRLSWWCKFTRMATFGNATKSLWKIRIAWSVIQHLMKSQHHNPFVNHSRHLPCHGSSLQNVSLVFGRLEIKVNIRKRCIKFPVFRNKYESLKEHSWKQAEPNT